MEREKVIIILDNIIIINNHLPHSRAHHPRRRPHLPRAGGRASEGADRGVRGGEPQIQCRLNSGRLKVFADIANKGGFLKSIIGQTQ